MRVEQGEDCQCTADSNDERDYDIAQFSRINWFPHNSVPEREEGRKGSKRCAIPSFRNFGKAADFSSYPAMRVSRPTPTELTLEPKQQS